MRILFVCLGNICRSPTADGVMRKLVGEAGLAGEIETESAGTGPWHVGRPPDARAAAAAAERGYTLPGVGRLVEPADFERYDMLVAMDRQNRAELLVMAPTPELRLKVRMLREFDPAASELDVPDPYGGGDRGFRTTLGLIESACRGLLDALSVDAPAA